MKRFIMVVLFVAMVVLCSTRAMGLEEYPMLLSITCGQWVTYEDDFVQANALNMRERGNYVEEIDMALKKIEAIADKFNYISGMMDAYDTVSKLENNDYFSFPFKVGQYNTELDVVCSSPENSEVLVSLVILAVNELMRAQ